MFPKLTLTRSKTPCSPPERGVTRFTTGAAGDPFLGQAGREERAPEYRVEMICPDEAVAAATEALRAAHPYEEPAFDFIRIEGC